MQEKYVKGLVAGKTQRQAYLDAGYSNQKGNMNYVDIKASELFADVKVKLRYEYLYNKMNKKSLDRVQWSLDKSARELLELIEEAKDNLTGTFINSETGNEIKMGKHEFKIKAKVIQDSIKELNNMYGYNSKNINLDANVTTYEDSLKEVEGDTF